MNGNEDVFALEDLTPSRASALLASTGLMPQTAEVIAIDGESFGTGQSGTSVKLRLSYRDPSVSGPDTLVAKFASESADARAFANAAGMYEREVRFYTELAGLVSVRAPSAIYARLNPNDGRFCILMEDLAEARIVDQLEGCTADEAALVMDQAAALHAGSWRHPGLQALPWLRGTAEATAQIAGVLPDFMDTYGERYGDSFGPAAIQAAEEMVELRDQWAAAAADPICLWHQDFRCDNMLFDAQSGAIPLAIVDWQTIGMGRGMADIAYFIGTSLPTDVRRAHERDLVSHYHRALVAGGVEGYDFDACWRHYRENVAQAIFTVIHASVRAARTDRGDRMWQSWARRSAAQALDLETFAALRTR